MPDVNSKVPPKFVPTLTEVVQPGDLLPAAVQVPEPEVLAPPVAPPAPVPAPTSTPAPIDAVLAPKRVALPWRIPSPVPVVPPAIHFAPEEPEGPVVPAAPAAVVPKEPSALKEGFEEYVVHRVMQRVDVVLEQRLREAIDTVIREQTRSMVPRLREEVESVVRQSVYEAVADELAQERPPV